MWIEYIYAPMGVQMHVNGEETVKRCLKLFLETWIFEKI